MEKFWKFAKRPRIEQRDNDYAYRSNNENYTVIQQHEKSLEIAREQGRYGLQEAQAHLHLGDCYLSNNRNETAIQHFKNALEIAREQGYRLEEGQAYLGLGYCYRNNNRNETAIQHYQKGLEVAREQGYKLQETRAYLELGEWYRFKNRNEAAIQYYEKALEIAREQGYTLQETVSHLLLGYCSYISSNENETTIQHYQKALEIARQQGYKLQEATAYLGLGDFYRSNNENEAAIQHYQKALGTSREQNYKLQETLAHLLLGCSWYISSNENETAIEHYQKALEIARQQGYKLLETQAYLRSGDFYRSNNRNETAINRYQKALEIARKQGYKLHETVAYLLLGYCWYISNNKNETAIQHYQKAFEIARQQGYKLQETQAYIRWGEWYRSNNKNAAAIQHYQKALEIARQKGYKLQETRVYLGVGACYMSNNMKEAAIKHYQSALEIARKQGYKLQETQAYLWLGEAYRSENQNQTATQCYEKGLEIAREQGYRLQETQARLWLGEACRSDNQNHMAIQHYEKALEIAREKGYKLHKKEAYLGLGKAYKSEKTFQEECQGSKSLAEYENKEFLDFAVSWKWKEGSIIHRQKFISLREYAKTHPKEIKEVNGVRVCCSKQFLIGKGSDGTRVYMGLGKDGIEKAVKRLPRDACYNLAEQEKKILNELNTKRSKYVVNYWFLEEQSDKDYLFLILDLCEETLENFVKSRCNKDLVTYAPDIIRQVLKGLVDLHRDPNPILHRDLKPSNILRNIQDKWLLADFGISRILTEDKATHESMSRGAEDWKAVESCSLKGKDGEGKSSNVRYKKESDIQVAGMVAFYIVTNGEHPFGEKPDRLRNLLDGKPVGLDKLKDAAAKDLISWMLNHDPKDRPSAEKALKHPYLQPAKQQFEMLCRVGNQPEIKTEDVKSDVVRKLNSNSEDWRNKIAPDVLRFLSTDCLKRRPVFYGTTWTDCLRLIRNVKQHWHDRPSPRPEAFYIVEDPQKYFLNLFPSLSVEVHKIIRSCDWNERDDLKEYFGGA